MDIMATMAIMNKTVVQNCDVTELLLQCVCYIYKSFLRGGRGQDWNLFSTSTANFDSNLISHVLSSFNFTQFFGIFFHRNAFLCVKTSCKSM